MESKGFTLTNQLNGSQLWITKAHNPKQKSYEVLVSDGKQNVWYKVGIIRDIDKLNEILNS